MVNLNSTNLYCLSIGNKVGSHLDQGQPSVQLLTTSSDSTWKTNTKLMSRMIFTLLIKIRGGLMD